MGPFAGASSGRGITGGEAANSRRNSLCPGTGNIPDPKWRKIPSTVCSFLKAQGSPYTPKKCGVLTCNKANTKASYEEPVFFFAVRSLLSLDRLKTSQADG